MRMMLFINDLRATNLPDSQSESRCQCLQSPDFERRFYRTVAFNALRSAVAAFI
jgi:hypothetical protein